MRQEKALARAKPGTGTTIDFSGTWLNELGSTMTLMKQNTCTFFAATRGFAPLDPRHQKLYMIPVAIEKQGFPALFV
jgi:hypothetical protein